MQRHNFFQFQRFVNQTVCFFSQMKDIKHIGPDFHLVPWVMLALGGAGGGQKFNDLNMVMWHIKLKGMSSRPGNTEKIYPIVTENSSQIVAVISLMQIYTYCDRKFITFCSSNIYLMQILTYCDRKFFTYCSSNLFTYCDRKFFTCCSSDLFNANFDILWQKVLHIL